MDTLEGKVAVVTGAASGIGRATAQRMAEAGAKVVLADVEAEALDKAVAELSAEGHEAIGVPTDVRSAEANDALRDAAVAAFGTVHVVCLNAGVGSGGRVWETPLEDYRWVIDVNLFGVVNGLRSFVPLLLEQGEGHVVNTASMAGLTSSPFMAAYNISKHGVVTLSETLKAELSMEGSPVGVSVLCPGWVNTRIHESHRNRPDEAPGPPEPDELEEGAATLRDVLGTMIAEGLDPLEVADMVVDAVLTGRFYILTHPEWMPMISARVDRIMNGEDPGQSFLPPV